MRPATVAAMVAPHPRAATTARSLLSQRGGQPLGLDLVQLSHFLKRTRRTRVVRSDDPGTRCRIGDAELHDPFELPSAADDRKRIREVPAGEPSLEWAIRSHPKRRVAWGRVRTETKTENAREYDTRMTEEERRYLVGIFEPDIHHLERLLGWDCSSWLA